MNYVITSGTPVSFSGIFRETAQMYEQNVNDPGNSILTYEVITFQPSHNQGFTKLLLYILMPCSWVLPGICGPGVKDSSRSLCTSTQASAILYCWC